ncbi:MAG: DUF4625 domain-containing protein [Bacteroidales bacterium]|nr:DUF4625 domain-containing protein [Bacteroidales bacterium]
MNRYLSIFLLCALCACSSSSGEKDLVPPEILPVEEYISPTNCQEYPLGTFLPVACLFTDDVELGSFNLEVHNNFDHHTHGTEAGECRQDPKKDPVNPWIYNKDYKIPAGQSSYEVDLKIPIPEDVDLGEYHFMIRLTDASGWQQLRSVSIRLIEALD